jgi:N-acetylglutamate synthase-like GNAT family acetyltransferase
MMFGGGFDTDIKKNRPSFWMAEQHGVVVGTISGFKTADKQYRSRGIWIRETARGQGLSLELFRTVQDRAIEQRCDIIWSYPRLTSLAAYKKFGFDTIGQLVEDDDPYSPHVYVSKKI